MIKKNSKIFIAGHNGLVGNAIYRLLKKKHYKKIITASRKKLDLTNKKKVKDFFKKKRPEFVIMCAAKVGGILENKNYQLDFLLENTEIQNNILLLAKKFKVKRVVFLGSSCIYPKNSKIPIKEDYIMTGKLEKTNEAYAMSKLYGIKLSSILYEELDQDIICLMPTNLYGIKDNFDIKSSHVIPGLITKFLNAKKNKTNVKVWGTGKAIREFMYVDDLANAIFKTLITPRSNIIKIFQKKLPVINVGTGEYVSILQLVKKIKKIVKFKGKILFDKNYPDGTLIKNLDSSKIRKLKWRPKIKLNTGLKKVVNSRLKLMN